MVEISKGIEILHQALWLKKSRTLVISDLHLGYEECLHQKGILLPKFQVQETIQQLTKILAQVKPKAIIINGDLKHEFGTVLRQEWKDVLNLIDFLLKSSDFPIKVILIRGNHDTILGSIASKRGLKIVNECQLDDILFIHGDKLIEARKIAVPIKRIIIGHEHPAISLREKGKVEKYKCFLKGKWKGKELIVMPSFNPLIEGADITKDKLLSPFLEDISNFEVYVLGEEEVLSFGKVKNLVKRSFLN